MALKKAFLGIPFLLLLLTVNVSGEDAIRESSSTDGISARLKIERERSSRKGGEAIRITGRIINNTDSRKSVKIEIYLKDFSGNITQSRFEIPSPPILEPGKEGTFATRFYVWNRDDAWRVGYTVYGY